MCLSGRGMEIERCTLPRVSKLVEAVVFDFLELGFEASMDFNGRHRKKDGGALICFVEKVVFALLL
jgi:hypothetical protein